MRRRIVRLEVENYKGVKAVDITPREGVTEISGPNGSGKSSTLESIQVWIDGLRAAPAEPIRQGAERCRIRGNLGDLFVTRFIERKKGGGHTTRLLFEPAGEKPYPATQKLLDDLIGEHHLDPLDFLKLDSKGKFDAFQVFVPGFDFAKCARENAADYARRTDVNKLAREARAAANLIHVPDGTPVERIDEQALITELQQAGDQNTETEQRRQRRQALADVIAELRVRAAKAGPDIDRTKQEITAAREREVARIDNQIRALERQRADVIAEYDGRAVTETERIQAEAQAATKDADEKQAKLDGAGPLPELVDTAAISKRIEGARQGNAAVAQAETRNKHVSTAERYEAESKGLTEAMEARQAAKQAAIAAAKLPIPGIDFGDNDILLNGIPIDQANMALRIRAAVAYCAARNPQLPLVWIKDASLLDDDSYAEVGRIAAEYGIDVYLETVRAIGKDAIVLSDGAVAAPALTSEAAA